MKRSWKYYATFAGGTLLILLVLGAIAFVQWANTVNPVQQPAREALYSDTNVTVHQGDWIVFEPNTPTDWGIIFYPGGKVDARAYAPPMRALAAAGYEVVITPMPLHMAFLAPNTASAVMAAYPNISHWIIAGHSLGGAMAANYVFNHPDAVAGLILWAAYPADNNDLSALELPTLLLYGTEDGAADTFPDTLSLLPANRTVNVIEGGNHAQFGYYGIQSGDGEATISREEQQSRILEATLSFLNSISGKN